MESRPDVPHQVRPSNNEETSDTPKGWLMLDGLDPEIKGANLLKVFLLIKQYRRLHTNAELFLSIEKAPISSTELARAVAMMSKATAPPPAPPSVAEFALTLLATGKTREALLGDLDERFAANVETLGLRRAKSLYWAEALRSLLPLLWSWMKRAGVCALVYAFVRKFTG